jgi:hypothetical protein
MRNFFFALTVTFLFYAFSDTFAISVLTLDNLLLIVYFVLFCIGIFSAYLIISIYRNETRKKVAYGFMGIILILMSLSSSKFIDSINDSSNIFESGVLSVNNNLPYMIDQDTRFEKVYLKNGDIYYEYTLVNLSRQNINHDFITLVMADKMSQFASLDRVVLGLSKKKREIHYIFLDKDSNYLTQVKLF